MYGGTNNCLQLLLMDIGVVGRIGAFAAKHVMMVWEHDFESVTTLHPHMGGKVVKVMETSEGCAYWRDVILVRTDKQWIM